MKNEKNNLFNLFWVQFLGALNDNIFKNALVILIAYKAINLFGLDSKMLVALAGAIFILPFFLLSSLAGDLSLKYDRILIVRWVKVIEVAIMFFASIGFYLQNYYLLFILLFLMGVHSTFFGPIKYSLIPEYVEDEKLVNANAWISAGTFIAILLGTVLGGIFASGDVGLWPLKYLLIGVSCLGMFFSYKLPLLNEGNENQFVEINLWHSVRKNIKVITSDREVFSLLFGLSWFWFLGAGILSIVPVIAKDILKGNEGVATFLLFVFTLGMGIGPFLLDKLFKGRIIKAIIPISLFLLSVFLFDLAFVIREFSNGNFLPQIFEAINVKQFLSLRFSYRIIFDFLMISFFGGIFTVLQFSELQTIVDSKSLSHVIAANNILNAVFMVAVSILIMLLHKMEMPLSVIIGIIGVLNVVSTMILLFFHRKEFDEYWSFE